MVDSLSVRFTNASVSKNAFKHSCAVECGNRFRVGAHAKNAVACRGLRVGPSRCSSFFPRSLLQLGGGELKGPRLAATNFGSGRA